MAMRVEGGSHGPLDVTPNAHLEQCMDDSAHGRILAANLADAVRLLLDVQDYRRIPAKEVWRGKPSRGSRKE